MSIFHIDFGALQDDSIPVHFWVAKEEEKEHIEYSNGKSKV